MSTITEQLDEILHGLQFEAWSHGLDNNQIYRSDYAVDEARTHLQALMLRKQIAELKILIDLKVDSKSLPFGNSLFTNHLVIEESIARLTQQLTALEGNTQEGEME